MPFGPRRGGGEDARIWRVGLVSFINRGPSAMLERIYSGWSTRRRGFVLLGLLVCTLLWAISVLLLWVFIRLASLLLPRFSTSLLDPIFFVHGIACSVLH